jgi:hypothetical protein
VVTLLPDDGTFPLAEIYPQEEPVVWGVVYTISASTAAATLDYLDYREKVFHLRIHLVEPLLSFILLIFFFLFLSQQTKYVLTIDMFFIGTSLSKLSLFLILQFILILRMDISEQKSMCMARMIFSCR